MIDRKAFIFDFRFTNNGTNLGIIGAIRRIKRFLGVICSF